jgi:flagellar assembly protein FliH
MPAMTSTERATIEREAFGQGFAQGERAGAEAAAARSEAVLQRLKQTVGELQALRAEMIHKTERQVVQLAIAMARRIVHREITLDQELLTAMARVALDRLGESANATIRLHPDDYAATAASQGEATGVVRIVADPMVRRGGCMVHSEFGLIDVSADAQIQELATALLGADDTREQLQAEASLVVA